MDYILSLFVSCFTILAMISTTGKKNGLIKLHKAYDSVEHFEYSIRWNHMTLLCVSSTGFEKKFCGFHNHRLKNKNGELFKVKYKIIATLFDGKCVNCILGNKATHWCLVCGKTSSEFQDKKKDFSPLSDIHLKLGLGLLRVKIKCFEQCLQLVYRIVYS